MSGIKALHPSGKLMGSDVRAWWPDPPVDEEEDDLGNFAPLSLVMRSSPYAVGKTLDTYDRRTFDPKMSHGAWQQAVQQLQAASTKLSEMERSMRNGLQLMAAASQAASLATSKQTQSRAPSFLSSSSRSKPNGSERSYARSAMTARSWSEEFKMQSANKVSDWISSQRPAKSRQIPPYKKIMEAERHGDNALRAMRDHETEKHQQAIREHPPVKTWPEIRPFETVTAKYVAADGKYMLREKQVFVDPSTLNREPGRASTSASPRREPLGPGPVVARDVVDECQKLLGRAMTPKRREQTMGAQIWNRFKGEQDPPEFRAVRVIPGADEAALARSIQERRQAARVGAKNDAAGAVASGHTQSSGAIGTSRRDQGRARGSDAAPFRAALASAGMEIGNPLLADERVRIPYQP